MKRFPRTHAPHPLQHTLTEGSVRHHLIRLTLPMVWGISATILLNVVDTYFVGRLGTNELAAYSFTFPVNFVLISLAIGLGAGTSSVIARAIGEGQHQTVQQLTSHSLVLSFLAVLLLSLVGIATIDPLFRLLHAPEDILPLIHSYMQVSYAGTVFLVVPMVGMSAMRAAGDAKLPSVLMIVMALINGVLDPLLIFGAGGLPALGLRGAAFAALIPRAVSFAVTLAVLHYDKRMLAVPSESAWSAALESWEVFLSSCSAVWRSWKALLHIGLPAAATNMIIPISVSVITRLVAHYGKGPIAAFGVASRIEAVALVPYYAMSSIIGPFVGQNLGVGRLDRVSEAMRSSFYFCLGYGLLVAALLAPFGPQLTRLFDSDPAVVVTATLYMRLMPLSYGLAGVVMIVNAAFNGLGRPGPAVVVSVTRTIVVYIPAAYWGSKWFGISGIFAGGSAASLIVGLLAYLYFQRQLQTGMLTGRPTPSLRDRD